MTQFQHHSKFPKEKKGQSYLFPHVCFSCRKSFKKPSSDTPRICPECGSRLVQLSRKFSAPKSSDIEQWKKVQYLVEHGFLFYSVYEQRERGIHYLVPYPKTLGEAKEFVEKYKK